MELFQNIMTHVHNKLYLPG